MTGRAAKITLRDLQITYDGETLEICSVQMPNHAVSLDAEAVDELVNFVRTIELETRVSDEPNRR